MRLGGVGGAVPLGTSTKRRKEVGLKEGGAVPLGTSTERRKGVRFR